MSINLQALKIEIQNDPLHRGYANLPDDKIAAIFSIMDRSVNREAIDGGLLASCIVRSEFNSLNANDQNYVRMLVSTATPIPLTAEFKAELGSVFNPQTGAVTRANLLSSIKRQGNRAEELNLGSIPTTSEVAEAKRL